MDIKDIEVLIECKRLVQAMLREKKYILSKMDGSGKDVRCVEKSIVRMERALQGLPPIDYCNL
jgi:hypothetical protein